MFVDSSSLKEQVIDDVVRSAFYSAGQRCSALRVVFVQSDVAGRVLGLSKRSNARNSSGRPQKSKH